MINLRLAHMSYCAETENISTVIKISVKLKYTVSKLPIYRRYDVFVYNLRTQVKVLTLSTSQGSIPLVTPIAISTTLPPAVTAMQQQQQGINRSVS